MEIGQIHEELAKVTRVWSKYFGTRMITPNDVRKIETYIEDGVRAEVVIYSMKVAGENAEGAPINYFYKVLDNCFKQGILTGKDLERRLGDGQREKGEQTMAQYGRAHKTDPKKHSKFKSEEYR